MSTKTWDLLSTRPKEKLKESDIVQTLLHNRNLVDKKQQQQFFHPTAPFDLTLKELEISKKSVEMALERLTKAQQNGERVIVFGDYDTDGICSAAILWETLFAAGLNVLPFIPNRFNDGYGIKPASIEKLKVTYPDLKLIITVDNGIVAHKAVEQSQRDGIDVLITDHHEEGETYPDALAIIHTKVLSGSGVAWIFAREICQHFKINTNEVLQSLELAAIGTIADQLPLIGANRSLVKFGLEKLRKTNRIGMLSLLKDGGIARDTVGMYEVGFVIAPRINAMGRMGDALESLRLICAKNPTKATQLANLMGKTNTQRQKIVDEVVNHAKQQALESKNSGVLVLADESYHEGIIGLAASKMVEVLGKPSIVISKGKEHSKGSARSIPGVHITQVLRDLDMLVEVGGHEMAAGFSIETAKIPQFQQKLEELTKELFTEEVLKRKIKIDLEVCLSEMTWELAEQLAEFEPAGVGNPTPSFLVRNAIITDSRTVGQDGKHLKLQVKQQDTIFDAIAFGFGNSLEPTLVTAVDFVCHLETNIWNGAKRLQLKIKDIRACQ